MDVSLKDCLVYLVTCSELGVAVCTTVGITSEEEDALESFSGIGIPKNGSLFMCATSNCLRKVNWLDAAGLKATTLAIGATTSGAGLSTLDGGLSNSSNSG
ncbi:hypothetical protein Tco_0621518 [Tanacetum coccineum]